MSMTRHTGRVRIVSNAPRPDAAPVNWIVMNAPRPLHGHRTGLPGGPEGLFTVAIDPAESDAPRMIKENRALDACTVVYLTPDLLLQIGLAHYIAKACTEEQIDRIAQCAADAPTLSSPADSVIATHGWDILNGTFNPTNGR